MEKTHVVMLLDESGSMGCHRQSVVSSFNQYKGSLAEETKRCFISLYKFDMAHGRFSRDFGNFPILRRVFKNRKVKECYDLTTEQYTPRGGTPLYDAIGQLIKKTKQRLPKEAKVLFVIHTDGFENASHEYSAERIKNMIKRLEKKRGWVFTYLGEGLAAWGQEVAMGFSNSFQYDSSMRGAATQTLTAASVNLCNNSKEAQYGTQSFYADAGIKEVEAKEDTASPSPDVVTTTTTNAAEDEASVS